MGLVDATTLVVLAQEAHAVQEVLDAERATTPPAFCLM